MHLVNKHYWLLLGHQNGLLVFDRPKHAENFIKMFVAIETLEVVPE
jgi:hypothetical protein